MSKIKLKIRKGDKVKVITGKDKGKSGKVTKVFPEQLKVIIEGINVAIVHKKPTQLNPKGGKITKEMPIHYSNVMILDPKVEMHSRIGFKMLEDGKKVRISRRSSEVIDNK